MTLENYLIDEDGAGDHFPVGMRVLLVDDDQLCLEVLGNMLRKCQYQVTTTIQSIEALDMLRTNRNMFDLVITDVNMPHMDGLKLLEIVGHEMDIPVIMLSELSDIEVVKKSVILGACDYIIKPPRIQVLQNIWQHVARRKIDCKGQNTHFNEEKACNIAGEGSQSISNADHNQMHGKKRKEPCVEEENGEMNAKENEEPSNQKKPRLKWNDDLQTKFLAAVNSLGIDKAVPKKILHLMNVEGRKHLETSSRACFLQIKAQVYHREFHQFQQSNYITSFEQFSSIDGSNGYVVSSNFPGNSSLLDEVLYEDQLPLNSLKFSSSNSHIGNNPVDFSSTSAIGIPLEDARGELQCKEGLLDNILKDSSKKRIDASLVGQLSEAAPSITQSTKVDKSYLDAGMKSNDAYILQPQEELTEEDIFGTLHDIVSDIG
ncbi:two-component response regulator ORR23-like [Gastrolobium bilobum]|uniref:two-component response regulator ORR23-like n=1 Tax=Gastrolobium bilobum TaxID=150636 RepID=UPI002AB20219|nr:two-component response regulator ORR23-like [Gastrolobium bilobum]